MLLTTEIDTLSAARDLVAGLAAEPWGQITPSPYETSRLVAQAPWLAGHRERITYLLTTQHPDGGWGGPDGYGLVPTLSATDALLSTGDHREPAERGLGWLRRHLGDRWPDTPAVEIIVPALVEDLARRGVQLPGGTPAECHAALAALCTRLRAGTSLPQKLLHSLEVVGAVARGAHGVHVAPLGTVGASPAATAVWRGPGAAGPYLDAVVRRHGGPVPSVLPISVFERAWVLSTLHDAGLRVPVPPAVRAGLVAHFGASGTPGGAGLPPDADTTSVVLTTLAQLGTPPRLDPLWAYEEGPYFRAWPGERTPSTSLNAHVLEALRLDPADPRAAAAAGRLAGWLRAEQQPAGCWWDKWHASPYYATACTAVALHRYGERTAVGAAGRGARWVLDTQRPDGSWGRFTGTAEETAYALTTLVHTGSGQDAAVARGRAYLLEHVDDEPPALWHDKDLYVPRAIVRSAVLAALHLTRRTPCPG